MTIVMEIDEKRNRARMVGKDKALIALKSDSSDANKPDVSFTNTTLLYLTDNMDTAYSLMADGKFVVPILNSDNASYDFSYFKYVVSNPQDIQEDYYVKLWQRLAGKPWHILDTNRCTLREMTIADIPAIQKIYSDNISTKFMRPFFPSNESPQSFIKNYTANVYSLFEFGTWIVERCCDRQIIGLVGFNYREDWGDYKIPNKYMGIGKHPELGYIIGKDYRRQGYAYEVCKAVIHYGMTELDFKKIYAITTSDNFDSIKLLSKLNQYPCISYFNNEDIVIKKWEHQK